MRIQTPEVHLVSYTQNALELLIYTKSTRLQGKQTLDDIMEWPMERKLDHLAYMRDTIQSSWEFVKYTFLIAGVTRSLTHQLVRTRTQSAIDDPAYGIPSANPAIISIAQESQRTVDASDNGFGMPPCREENVEFFEASFGEANSAYCEALRRGEPPQNARFLLPTGVTTSIITEWSLRALHDSGNVRLCTRTQGEYQDVFRLMRERVYDVHPWAKGWIEVFCVNNGTCCFPRYDKCPVQGSLFNPETGLRFDQAQVTDGVHVVLVPQRPAKRSEIIEMWETNRHEARPVAREGKSM